MELNKPKFIRDNDTFLTIYGRNLLAELDIILPDNYLIVTMEDLWEKYKHNFKNKQKNVYIVKGLDINKVNEDFKNLNNFSTIVGIGGGQSLDIAKYFAWKSSVKLFQVPTSMSVNATFGHRAAIRIHGQPVNFGVYLGSLLHETKAEEMFDYILRAGVDIRPEAMGITWDDMSNALINMRDYVNKIGLWHSIVHDKEIDENFVADLKIKIDNKYKTFNND